MPRIRIKRGLARVLDDMAAAGQLAAGELYWLTNEKRLAVGDSPNSFVRVPTPSDVPLAKPRIAIDLQYSEPLATGRLYWMTDENRLAVASSTSSFVRLARKDEVSSSGGVSAAKLFFLTH